LIAKIFWNGCSCWFQKRGPSAKRGYLCPKKRPWQETDYALSVFGNAPAAARRSYAAYVKTGYGQGRRPELTGGGLIRSLGGWAALKKLRLKDQDRLKGDERILGDSVIL